MMSYSKQILSFTALAIAIGLSGCGQNVAGCIDPEGNQDRELMCEEVNSHRLNSGVPLLSLDQELSRAAQSHAMDMNRRGYFSHTTPEGESLSARLREAGVKYQMVGENIAYGQASVDSAMSTWLNSAPHRDNILRPAFRRIGVGRSGKHWVQIFAN